jgi:hypothetical protein
MTKEYLPNFNMVSRSSEVFTSFRGPLLSYHIVKSIDREKGVCRRWTVFSQGKRSVLVHYMFGKLLWDNLNSNESKIFWHLSEITNNISIYLSLKALALGIDKKLLRKRLEFLHEKFGLEFVTRQQYLTIKGRVNFFFLEELVNLRRVPKFSGYTKHHKDQGSLGPEREDELSEILEPVVDVSEDFFWTYLSVGKISLFGGECSFPDETSKSRNGLSL